MVPSSSTALVRSDPESLDDLLDRLQRSIEAVIHGKSELVGHVLCALLARGHVLLEDVPGVGKTTLAQAVARALGGSFSRIQFTADLLPSDIIGINVYEQDRGEFRFRPGPVFANVVLADEINRTPPKTQSSLLEAMNEGQVSVDGVVHALPSPFLVLATQNPLEHHGTFPLPESQVDRFLMRLEVGYPDRESERLLLRETTGRQPRAEPVLDADGVRDLQAQAMAVELHRDLEDYLLAVVHATRGHPEIALGASPRATQALVRAVRARAFLLRRSYAIPDDLLAVAEPVLAHRLVPAFRPDPTGPAPRDSRALLREILGSVPAPR